MFSWPLLTTSLLGEPVENLQCKTSGGAGPPKTPQPLPRDLGFCRALLGPPAIPAWAPRPQNVKARPQGANAPALHFQAPSSSPAVRLTQ